MRSLWKPVVLALPLSLMACSGEEAAVAPSEATATATVNSAIPAAVVARIGGTLIAAGDLFVELLPRAGGQLSAIVYDAQGEPLPAGATLSATVKTSAGAAKPVQLDYMPSIGAFAAELDGELEVVPGPVEVTVTSGGQTRHGTRPTIAVAPLPSHGGTVLVAGDIAAELRVRPEGAVDAYFVDAGGAAVTAQLEGSPQVIVLGSDGAPHSVDLRWDAEAGHHVGAASGELRFVPGPLVLVVQAGPVVHRSRIERVAVLRAPSHGGEVAVVGDYTVELVPGDDYVEAYVVDASGAPLTGRADFTANIGVDYAPVTMTWNAQAGCYRAPRHASVNLDVHPIELSLVARGHRHHGGMRARVVTHHVEVEAPSARGHVHVEAPSARFEARATRPGATASVRVQAPRPPSVHIEVPRPPTVRVRAGASAGAGSSRGGGSAGASAGAGFRFGN